jgi:hypothetical protein
MSSSNPINPSGTTNSVGHVAGAVGVTIAAMLLLAPSAGVAQDASLLRGVVTDSAGRRVPAAELMVPQYGWVLRADSVGRFEVPELGAGQLAVTARHAAFKPSTVVLAFSGRDTITHDFVLARSQQTLAQVTVTATQPVTVRMTEFERRRASGFGSFVTREQLGQWSHRKLSEVLRTVPGIALAISDPRTGALSVAAKRGAQAAGGGSCFSQVIIDGVRIYSSVPVVSLMQQQGPTSIRSRAGRSSPNGPPPPVIDDLAPGDIEGIEVYGGIAQTPTEFSGPGARCGTVVIWTRVGGS